MKIYVVGSSKNKFLPLDNIREKFLIDQKHAGDNIDFLNPWYYECMFQNVPIKIKGIISEDCNLSDYHHAKLWNLIWKFWEK